MILFSIIYLIIFYIDWLLLRIFFIYYEDGAVCWYEDDIIIIFNFLPLFNILLLLVMIYGVYKIFTFKKTKCEYVDKPKYNTFWEWFYQTKSYKLK